MKISKTLILAALGVISLNSCGEGNAEKDAAVPMQNDSRSAEEAEVSKNLDDGSKTANPEFKNEDIAAVYSHYSHVKTALVNSNAEEAQNGGEMLVKALQQTESAEDALEAAEKIAKSENLNEQRTAFSDLSGAVENILSGSLASGEIYKQYCPMAFEGAGGYWLSSSEEIRNPYYGDKMLKCGSVRDTLQ
ncbi:MAG TPA: DUF3347 domain-containing protein [Salinimicrobium sp.]|nr:DUF3347 domain-containing protein [Salinimicrobium sp.]